SGSVSVLGAEPITGDSGWRSQIGIVLQTSSDHGRWRPRQLLSRLSDFYRPYVDPWSVDELLSMVGLEEQADQKLQTLSVGQRRRLDVAMAVIRSEEHTSELQSRFDLVCRLLLEKKKAL